MQEVPKRSDHNPNSTHYLWTIKHDEVRVEDLSFTFLGTIHIAPLKSLKNMLAIDYSMYR